MLNLAIRIYYVAMPVCAGLQTLTMVYMALVLNKISKKKEEKQWVKQRS